MTKPEAIYSHFHSNLKFHGRGCFPEQMVKVGEIRQCKNLKNFRHPRKLYNYPKFGTVQFYTVVCPKDADRMANSVDLDQEQLDLGVNCLPRSVCLKAKDHYGQWPKAVYSLSHFNLKLCRQDSYEDYFVAIASVYRCNQNVFLGKA